MVVVAQVILTDQNTMDHSFVVNKKDSPSFKGDVITLSICKEWVYVLMLLYRR